MNHWTENLAIFEGGLGRNRYCTEYVLSLKITLKYYNIRPQSVFTS